MPSPAGFDPFFGMGGQFGGPFGAPDPFAGMGMGMPPMGGMGGGFLDPFWTPGAGAGSRRRLSAPTATTEERGEGARRTREPYTIGSAGWTRSIPCDFIEARRQPCCLAAAHAVHAAVPAEPAISSRHVGLPASCSCCACCTACCACDFIEAC